jgi:hypothetical protein
MKQLLQYSCLGLLLMLGCCDPTDNNTSEQKNVSKLNAAVGREIPLQSAHQWIANYKKKNGREISYQVDKAQLQNLLGAVPHPLGVIFNYATDDSGNSHIVVIALDETESLWAPSAIAVDANSNTIIEVNTAKAWTRRYRNNNPNAVRHHSFGINLFNKILSNPGFEYFDISPALNDNGLQMVLMVWNKSETSNGGRVNTGGLTPVSYDDSFRCPPTCNDEITND